jgi:hypothetical protein
VYEIRLAYESEGDTLRQFIEQHWRKDHIFVTCKELFDWQHLDRKRGRYNFVIGIDIQTQAIHGILGFIPLTQFDPEIEFKRLCWLAIWKVQDEAQGHKLGRHILSYLEDTVKPDVISAVAASSMTLRMYEDRGYQVGRLRQHFILNPDKDIFQMVANKKPGQPSASESTHASHKRLELATENDIINDETDCFLTQKDLPQKSPNYLVNRYFRHPVYRYQTYRILERERTTGIIVTRVCNNKESCAIRIVDFVGPSAALRGLREEWFHLLKNINAEYIDFYCAGINEDDLIASGFLCCEEGDEIIIPNHFEPFSKTKVNIDYSISTPVGVAYRMVKGDSDQDRPNFI